MDHVVLLRRRIAVKTQLPDRKQSLIGKIKEETNSEHVEIGLFTVKRMGMSNSSRLKSPDGVDPCWILELGLYW